MAKRKRSDEDQRITKLRYREETKERCVEWPWIDRVTLPSIPNIKTLDDLLNVAWNYKCVPKKPYFNWVRLWLMMPWLLELKKTVGMEKAKDTLISIILYHLQPSGTSAIPLHTLIIGEEGGGKTHLARIVRGIYKCLGIFNETKVIVAKDSDFTESKFKQLLVDAKGGILIIDDLDLGISKTLLGLLNTFLIETTDTVVIATSREEQDNFPWQLTIGGYTTKDLFDMFKQKAEGWQIQDAADLFKKSLFPRLGKDVENLFIKTKVAHARKSSTLNQASSQTLTRDDLLEGIRMYKTKTSERPSYIS